VDREGYLGLEAYWAVEDGVYFGGEVGHAGTDSAVAADGDTIRDFDFVALELNTKKVFGLARGLSCSVGLGGAVFYVDGEEISVLGGEESSDPLADIGFGAQAFAGLDWRARKFIIGVDVKYQMAFDVLNIDYSNLRMGGHLGLVF
jgi:hypothetical protein